MSERIFACITDNVVVNTVVGDDAFADLVRPDHDDVAEITDLSPRPGIHWTVHPDGYRPPQPYPSWAWDEQAAEYFAPTPDPGDGSLWDEDSLSWIAPEPDPEPEPEPVTE